MSDEQEQAVTAQGAWQVKCSEILPVHLSETTEKVIAELCEERDLDSDKALSFFLGVIIRSMKQKVNSPTEQSAFEDLLWQVVKECPG